MKIYSSTLDYLDEILKAESGDTDAMIRVAFAILHGNKTKKLQPEEAERAIRYYKTAIERGDKSAMLDLAACYMNGRGVARDVDEAMRLYEAGWDPDSASSCFCLGCVNRYDYLENGDEIPTRDPERIKKAVPYFLRGVQLGGSDCCYELTELYLSGNGVEKDSEKALELLLEAYDFIDREILSGRALHIYLRLAEFYHYGIGTEPDIEEALEYIEMFMEEHRYMSRYGEPVSEALIRRAKKEWKEINKEIAKSTIE